MKAHSLPHCVLSPLAQNFPHQQPRLSLLLLACQRRVVSLLLSRFGEHKLAARSACSVLAGCIQLVRKEKGSALTLLATETPQPGFVAVFILTPPDQQEKEMALTGEGADDLGKGCDPGRLRRRCPPALRPCSKHRSRGQSGEQLVQRMEGE